MAGGLSFFDYAKEAFHLRVPIKGLGQVPMNKFLLAGVGILGFAHPGFWLLGLAAEAGYLMFLPSNERFQKVVKGMQASAGLKGLDESINSVLKGLGRPDQDRFLKLEALCREMLPTVSGSSLGLIQGRSLQQLLFAFVQLLQTRARVANLTTKVKPKDLELEIANLETKLKQARPESPLERSLQSSLDIARKRQENAKHAKESLEVLEAELIRIESQVALMREESALATGGEGMSARLDGILGSLRETSVWMRSHGDLLGPEGMELDLGGIPGIGRTGGTEAA